MAFFTEAINDGTIDKRTKMSEQEVENAIMARIMNSSAWDLHERRFHKDGSSAHLSTVAQEGGFSEIERHAGKREENRPAISYDSNTKNFVAGCNCGKEKFVFNMKEDKVESMSPSLKMKDINAPYRKNNQMKEEVPTAILAVVIVLKVEIMARNQIIYTDLILADIDQERK